MILSFISAGMKSVARALNAALLTSIGLTPVFSRTKLWPMAIFGIWPIAFSTTRSFSPVLAAAAGAFFGAAAWPADTGAARRAHAHTHTSENIFMDESLSAL